MILSHKIALDATDDQCAWFSQQCGYARFAFNHALSDYNNEPRPWKELNTRFNIAKRAIDWTREMDQRAALFGIKHLGDAISRNDAHHKATTEIINMASVIGIETLKMTNMLRNKNLAKALSDSALGGFLSLLKSKAEVLGVPVIEAPQFYASSKTCSHCGHKRKALSLSERTYHCSECSSSIDRDINAAINLKTLAVGQTER